MVALLDANVLIALFDPSHVHHEAAHRWFTTNRNGGWAICPLTENAFVRIVTNSAYAGLPTDMNFAASHLRNFCSERDHVFWADSITIRDAGRYEWKHMQGHRQLTDVYLLALVVANNGRLATFDSSIPLAAIRSATLRNLAIIDE